MVIFHGDTFTIWTKQELLDIDKIKSLIIWKRSGQAAPHKPLLILLALGYLQNNDQRLLSFKDIEPKLNYLLEEYGPPRKSLHPEYPFWRLQNDDIWEVMDKDKLETRKSNTS